MARKPVCSDPLFVRFFKQFVRFIWQSILWMLSGIGRVVIVFIFLVFVGNLFSETMPNRSILTIDLSKGITEYDSSLSVFDTHTPYTHHALIQKIKAAGTDPRVKALVFYGDDMPVQLSTIQEIIAALDVYHQSGKKSYFYGRSIGGGVGSGWMEYYFASHCSDITLSPVGQINLFGLAVEKPFVKSLFDDLGITPEFNSRHEYKTAADMYRRKKMSRTDRENTRALLDDLYAQMNLSTAKDGIVFAKDAKDSGMVNALTYFDDFKAKLEKEYKGEFIDVSYLSLKDRNHRKKVGVLVLSGVIMPDPVETQNGVITPDFVRDALENVRTSKLDALVVRVNSPGGDYIASDEIYQMLKSLKVPVIVSQGSVAASGGYFISLAGNTIVANPATITGSIGVVGGKFHLQKLMNKWGVRVERETVGALAGFASASFPMTRAQRRAFNESLDLIYDDFTTKVAKERKMNTATLDRFARGRVFTGKQAKANGLVDQLGGLDTAISIASKELKMKKGQVPELIYYTPDPKRFGMLKRLLSAQISVFETFQGLMLQSRGNVQLPPQRIVY